MIASKSGVFIYKYMHKLGLQNEIIQYHCIIHQQKLIDKALN
jgi:hypothetical protein